MALFPQINCRRCHRTYSSLRGRCPYCGARKVQSSGRTAVPTSATQPGTEGHARAKVNNQMQTLVGLILLAVVVILVIILVSVGLSGRDAAPLPSPSPPVSLAPSPTPPPPSTPTPTPTPTVSSVKIYYGSRETKDFTEPAGGTIQLKAQIFPTDVVVTPEWKSADESIATVDQTGLVTMVGSSKQMTTITVTVGGISATCIARVK